MSTIMPPAIDYKKLKRMCERLHPRFSAAIKAGHNDFRSIRNEVGEYLTGHGPCPDATRLLLLQRRLMEETEY